ncbi:TolC family protein [Runella sp.]|uniref:TolC family protein n=1 Tax=Runella sp. TaxID=1960881 RepID=UPI003D10364D
MEILKKHHLLVKITLLLSSCIPTLAQKNLTLTEAVQTAVSNYGTIKAKASYASASKVSIEQARRDYLPNVNLAGQMDYGTVNGQNGPLYGFGGLGVASSGLPLPKENWNAAFGAMYLTNVNWDFYAFGRAKEKINTATAVAYRDEKDWQQEIFQHQIRVAAAYLNLLTAQRLTASYQKNLSRAETFRSVVVTRAKNELIAGVDSSQANAEISNVKITLTKALDFQQEQANILARLLGIPAQEFILDTLFVTKLPALINEEGQATVQQHPTLQFYRSRINLSDGQAKYYRTLAFPTLSLVGVLQTRGSGFSNTYAQDQTAFTHNFFEGIKPTRTNYLLGVGITWNLTQRLRISQQVKSQLLISKGLQEEYDLANQQLEAQLQLSDTKIKNALAIYREVPIQVKAASDAYLQKTVLYNNGLTNLVDVTQSLYTLIRAETDREIAYSNIWQALLLKAAAEGDFSIFTKNL